MYEVTIYRDSCHWEKEYFKDVYDAQEYCKLHTLNTRKWAALTNVSYLTINGKTTLYNDEMTVMFKDGQIVGVM